MYYKRESGERGRKAKKECDSRREADQTQKQREIAAVYRRIMAECGRDGGQDALVGVF